MKRISILVSGKVQGVFYRASTEKIAKQIGVIGFVKNLADGKVYIEAQGNEDQLKQFSEWCNRGPERAVVNDITIMEIHLGTEDNFKISR